MPRKQNGFGNPKSFAFKGNGKINVSKIERVAGKYPSIRDFGSIITRTPKEAFNVNSTWMKWRKGYEYFVKQRWVIFDIPDIVAEIFPSFRDKLEVKFQAIRFPTSNSDDATYYVTKRIVERHEPLLMQIAKLSNINGVNYTSEQAAYDEVWDIMEFNPAQNVVLKLIGETITNEPHPDWLIAKKEKYTTSIIKNIYTIDSVNIPSSWLTNGLLMPAVYYGNSKPKGTQIILRAEELFPYIDGPGTLEAIPESKYFELVGKQISILNAKSYYNVISDNYQFEEIDNDSFKSSVNFRGSRAGTPCDFIIYDAKSLEDDAGVIYRRDVVAFSNMANFGYEGEFIFDKKTYQRWFKIEFNAYLMERLVELVAPLIPTALTIKSISRVSNPTGFPNENVIIECEPFTSQIIYCKRPFIVTNVGGPGFERNCYITATGVKSYTQQFNELEEVKIPIYDGSIEDGFFDTDIIVKEKKLNINTNPVEDETYLIYDYLFLAERFACDCPSYSKSKITAPEALYEDNKIKANRQRRYPLPTAGSNKAKTLIDNTNDLAGIFNTWRTEQDRFKFQCCKHTISAYFSAGFNVIEPNEIPFYKDIETIGRNITQELDDTISSTSIKRAELSARGFVWSIVQLLVQTTAVIISTAAETGFFAFKPIEFLYGFKRLRNVLKTPNKTEEELNLFTAQQENIIDIKQIQ